MDCHENLPLQRQHLQTCRSAAPAQHSRSAFLWIKPGCVPPSHRIACPASYLGERQLLFMLLFKIKKLKITWKGKMFIGELEYLVMSRTAFISQAGCATHLRQKGGKQGYKVSGGEILSTTAHRIRPSTLQTVRFNLSCRPTKPLLAAR